MFLYFFIIYFFYEWDNLSLSSNSSNNVPLIVRTCNIYKCKSCHPEAKKLSQNEIKLIKEKINHMNKPRKWKICRGYHCKYCRYQCMKINKYIEDEYFYYAINKDIENKDENKNENIKYNILENQPKIIENKNLEEDLDINEYKSVKIAKDGNCLLYSILTYLNIELKYANMLRKLIAKEVEDFEWNEEVLEGLLIESKSEIINKIKKENSFLGYKDITPFLTKYKITLKIWLKDDRYRGNGWLSINQKENEDHYIIGVSFHQGKFPEKDCEGHYSGIENKNLNMTNELKLKILQEFIKIAEKEKIIKEPSNKSKFNILIWNVKSIIRLYKN